MFISGSDNSVIPVRFNFGEIVRIGRHHNALMKIDKVRFFGEDGIRYIGLHCVGGGESAAEHLCQKASSEDLRIWKEFKGYRQEI